jgi:phage/plasmid primase-like uncharacterized protein
MKMHALVAAAAVVLAQGLAGAAEIIKFVTAPSAAAAYKAKGMEPAAHRH